MSEKLKHFPFYITYADVDDYCFWVIDVYGYDEGSGFVRLIDKKFIDKMTNPGKYKLNADELLLEIRQCLVDSGFEKEVTACDKAFAEKRAGRGSKNPYIPMHKRWEMDDAAWKQEYEKER